MGDSSSLPNLRTSRFSWLAVDTAQRESDALLVAFSGGSDSTALLAALVAARKERVAPFAERPLPLAAAHIHHGLQPAADAWVTHCVAQCTAWQIPCFVRRVTVEEEAVGRLGLEAAARAARYRALAAIAQQWGEELFRCGVGRDAHDRPLRITIVTAHHRDDQVETFWFRLLRGSGVRGLTGMRSWERFPVVACGEMEGANPPGEGRRVVLSLWRPLLATAKGALTDALIAAGIPWVEDPTNEQIEAHAHRGWRRNLLRHQLLPELRRLWPGLDRVTVRTAALMMEAQACLTDLAALDDRAVAHPLGGWAREAFARLPDYRQRNLLRWAIHHDHHQPPPAERLSEALRQLTGARGRKPRSFPLTPQVTLHADRDRLWVEGSGA